MDSKLLGFLVNPIAGMGGSVGLKGTDTVEIYREALRRGAVKISPLKARKVLSTLMLIKDSIKIITCSGEMGEYYVKEFSFPYVEVLEVNKLETTAEDTKKCAKEMAKRGVNLILFVGGDGTARDIVESINMHVPILGVPSGVKMYSSVFASNPQAAGAITMKFLQGEISLRECEVIDIDEELFRKGILSAKLYGYALSPYEPILIQGLKTFTVLTDSEIENQKAIARFIVEEMDDSLYILGPGSTVKAITDILNLPKTLLGVDLLHNKRILALDVDENRILNELNRFPKAKIIVTPIGNQGFIFGRGNQQISPKVIRRVGVENIIVISTKTKIANLKFLRVDTGDEEIDNMLRKYIKVAVDYWEYKMIKVI
ncbi:MAG: ATP-NAD kinase family protein [Candidatus Methanomethylicia archaeon]